MSNYSLASLLFCMLVMVGCTAIPSDEKSSLLNTNYRQQTENLEEQNSRSKDLDSDERKIEAAILASAEEDFKTVTRLLSSIKDPEKNSYVKSNFLIIEAERAIHLKRPKRASDILEGLSEEGTLNASYRMRMSNLKAKIFYLEKDFFSHARELISISRILEKSKKKSNQEQIFHSLMMLSKKKLETLLQEQLSVEERGWILLASVVRANEENLQKQFLAFEEWEKNWLGHPAQIDPPDRITFLPQMIKQSPETVALILPLSEKYSKFGEAIRDGFIAAHYQSEEKKRILVYDSNSSEIVKLIEKASRDNADVIVGPLDRQRVTALANHRLPVQTLALNRAEGFSEQTNLFQFGLAPEDESEQVARKAFEAGYRRALIIAPETDWGERNHKAFKKTFSELGGETLESARFSRQKDYSDLVKELFEVDSSESRASRLSRIIGKKIEFKARRRKDVDFIFLLANNNQARGIKPTISFFYGEDLPVLATSHINRNSANKLNNIDLNGIYFCEIPWNLENQNKVQAEIMNTLEGGSGQLAPFFALGADAHRIVQQLEQIKQFPSDPVFGSTGLLRMNANKEIKRTLTWAKFEDAIIKLKEPGTILR
ncbi:penicillin-binding protein activator [Gammaproteobacteria bacterium]|nr:penicillin-binding protein activator [Gammaproteobacteria bacterium]